MKLKFEIKQMGDYRQYPYTDIAIRMKVMFANSDYREFRRRALEKRIADYGVCSSWT